LYDKTKTVYKLQKLQQKYVNLLNLVDVSQEKSYVTTANANTNNK